MIGSLVAIGRDRTAGLRVLVAALVLAARLAFSLLPMPAFAASGAGATVEDPAVAAFGTVAICHAGQGVALPDRGHAPSRQGHDCDVCPVCHVLAASVVLPADGPDVSRIVRTSAALPPSLYAETLVMRPRVLATGPRGPPAPIA